MSQTQLQTLLADSEALQALVGRTVRYLDEDYDICDILVDEKMLILASHCDKSVQDDSFGRATRMVPKQHRLRFCDDDGNATVIWDELIFLDGAM
ncbi:MAG: hypothetical protein R8M14_06775 [Ghiorsea sp.]